MLSNVYIVGLNIIVYYMQDDCLRRSNVGYNKLHRLLLKWRN